MQNSPSLVEQEIQGYITNLDAWILDVSNMKTLASCNGVKVRFAIECHMLKAYLEAADVPSSADLVDFSDRHNSLQIQYQNLVSDQQ